MDGIRKHSVLVAEAEPLARRGLASLLNEQPQMRLCAEAGSMAQARELCEAHRPEVLVLDPAQGDGFILIKDLPRWCPETRVVVHSSLEDAASVQRAFQAGALGYVSRRDPESALLAAIMSAVSGERELGPRAARVLFGDLARGAVQMQQGELEMLSDRERDVFRLIGTGRCTSQVAEELHMSVKTVETHRQRIRGKLGLKSGAELVKRAVLHDERAAAGAADRERRIDETPPSRATST